MINKHLCFLSIPGLRKQDLDQLPSLTGLLSQGVCSRLMGSFPCVTWPAQASLLTGTLPREHGVVANGFFWRESNQVEMWTAWNERIERPQIWDRLAAENGEIKSAVWFPMLSKGCHADYVCMPAPIHNPDGSESLWCYTKPSELYGELRDELGHFPLQHFWGPLAGIPSTKWIVDSAILAANRYRPHFFYIYLPHLDYAAQKHGPDSKEASHALAELNGVLGELEQGFGQAYAEGLDWVVASEYTIQPVDHVAYPNRVLRDAGLLQVVQTDEGELLDTAGSPAWSLVDHQFAHVFVNNGDLALVQKVAALFDDMEGIDQVLVGDQIASIGLDHPRTGEIVLVSAPNSWQAYYYWLDDAHAPNFAGTVDIHRKPGYDPVELCFDPATGRIPLDANLIRGSHGVPVENDANQSVLLCSLPIFEAAEVRDTDVADRIVEWFRI